jgi:hypothetical protein
MKRTLFAAAIAVISLAGCKKDEVIDRIPDVGTIRYINVSSDEYDFYLDDQKFGNLFGGDTARYGGVTTGAHRVKAIQKANIVISPIIKQQVVQVPKDTVVDFVFP